QMCKFWRMSKANGKRSVQLTPELEAWIKAGNPVRNSPDDPLPGRCGGVNQPRTGDRQAFCRMAAGRGTDHLGIGRCSFHPSLEDGLPPWVGTVSQEEWVQIAGGGGTRRHGMTPAAANPENIRDLTELFAANMEPEQREVFLSAIESRPEERLHILIATHTVVHREIMQDRHRARLQARGKVGRDAGVTALLTNHGQLMARLLEIERAYADLGEQNKTRAAFRQFVANLTDAEYQRLKQHPEAMHRLLTGGSE
ncbi:MAG TPA: hypothetical protein VKZ85_03380, partial [Woeseiaceae bacterium]|nr:hypothetical protein [Woeseiaceae bacterium]